MGKDRKRLAERKNDGDFQRLKGFILADRQWHALWHWELGDRWSQIYTKRSYDHPVRNRLESDTEIRQKVRFVKNLLTDALLMRRSFTEAEVKSYSGRGMDWSHFKVLLGVPDKKKRRKYLHAWLQKPCGCRQLIKRIPQSSKRKAAKQGGAPVRAVKNIAEALDRLVSDNERWLIWGRHCVDTSKVFQEKRTVRFPNRLADRATQTLNEVKRYAETLLHQLEARTRHSRPTRRSLQRRRGTSPG